MPDCPTCGEFFDSKRGVKVHHSRKHGESIAGVQTECAGCGSVITRAPNEIEQSERHFCDSECMAKEKSNRMSTIVECTWCGDEIKRRDSKVADRNFCDYDCMSNWFSENKTGENASQWNGGSVTTSCDWCGEKIEKTAWKASQYDHTFCDRKCQSNWCSEEFSGNGNPSWSGGASGWYGPSWKKQRRKAIQRDGERCALCGLSRSDHYDVYDVDLHVHHKTPFKNFGIENHESANRLENLITVCRSCHDQIEPVSQKD